MAGERSTAVPWAVLAGCTVLALPTALRPGTAAGLAYLAGLALVVASLWWGTAHATGRARAGWRLVALAATCWLAGDAIARLPGGDEEAGLPDVLWLTAYPLLIGGVATMLVGRGWPHDVRRELRLDTTAVTVAVGVAAWQVLVAPELAGQGPDVATALAVLYPLGDVAAFAMAVTILLAPGRSRVPERLLIANLGWSLAVDGVISLLVVMAPGVDLSRFDALLLVGNGLLAAAALHPARDAVAQPPPGATGVPHMHRGRVLLLGAALVTVSMAAALPGASSMANRVMLVLAAAIVSGSVLLRFLGVVREREEAERLLEHRAQHDDLTGLANRSLLLERLADRQQAPPGAASRRVALFYVDLDGFKRVNDVWGHLAGDEVLRVVGRRLGEMTRRDDLVARLGGDEFVVLCPGIDGPDAEHLAEALLDAVRRPIPLPGGGEVGVGASVGVFVDAVPDDVEHLLHVADTAMYRAKQTGGGIRLAERQQDAAAVPADTSPSTPSG